MKKIFASLLALAGMVVGLTLTSCGGGGGSGDSPSLEGLTVTLSGDTPGFEVEFITRHGKSGNYTCLAKVGSDETTASFSLHPGYPQQTTDGKVTLKGNFGFQSGKWTITSSEVASLLGVATVSGSGCAIKELTMTLAFDEKGNGSLAWQGTANGFDNNGNATEEVEIDMSFPSGIYVNGPLKLLFNAAE